MVLPLRTAQLLFTESQDLGDVVTGRLLQNPFIFFRIGVGQPVSHPANHPPGKLILCGLQKFVGQAVGQFPNIKNAHGDRAERGPLQSERIKIPAKAVIE